MAKFLCYAVNVMSRVCLICAVLISLFVVGCKESNKPKSDGKLRAVCTIGMIDDIVKNVGGDRVESSALMGPGTDPHLYNPTARDLERLTNADVIFYAGLHLEGRMEDVLVKLSESKPVQPISQGIPKPLLRRPPDMQGKYDPHIWFDVQIWRFAVRNVAARLKAVDPEGTELYEKNEQAYLAMLDALHEDTIRDLSVIPKEQRILITAHDAFGYFGVRYGFEVRGIQGTSTVAEAGISEIRELVDIIVERKIKAIFVESSVPRTTIEALQKAVKARGWNVQIGGTLYSDAMGDADSPEGTYIGMFRHNIKTIIEGLAP